MAVQKVSTSPAVRIVAQALLLRRADPDRPALDVLDEAMQAHRSRLVDFGDLIDLPSPFALLVVEAFDRGMCVADWAGLWHGIRHPKIRGVPLSLWADEVWPQFRVRYGVF